jgi:hypothetical protein
MTQFALLENRSAKSSRAKEFHSLPVLLFSLFLHNRKIEFACATANAIVTQAGRASRSDKYFKPIRREAIVYHASGVEGRTREHFGVKS